MDTSNLTVVLILHDDIVHERAGEAYLKSGNATGVGPGILERYCTIESNHPIDNCV